MQTFNQSLLWLYRRGWITLELARQRSHNVDELQSMIDRGLGLGPPAQAGLAQARSKA